MAYKNLTAPTTNPAAAQRLADTQAIRARAAVQAQPQGAPIAQSAQQTGAGLTQAAGQQSLQTQQAQAGLAQNQAQNVLASQRLGQQQNLFEREQDLGRSGVKLDEKLFNISQAAAQEEADMRRNFNDRVAQTGHLQQLDLANWAVANAQSEEDFKGKMQEIEQAHAKKAAMVNHAYQLVMQEMKQEASKASIERRRELSMEIKQIQDAWAEEQRRQEREAANRSAMRSAGSTLIGVGVAAAASLIPGVAPFAPMIMAGTTAGLQGTGADKQIFG